MKVLRRFWCEAALLGIAAGVILGDGPRHTEGDYSGRELSWWVRTQAPELWDACRAALPEIGSPFSAYAIRYREGTNVARHFDSVKEGSRFGIVVLARAAEEGGELEYDGARVDLSVGDAVIFDLGRWHEVTRVLRGERWILMMGVGT